jgi:UDP-N-acetylglucosamine acyltransferase
MHVPPYMLVAGINEVHGLNIVGMKRWPGLTAESKQAIKDAYRILYRSNLSPQEAIEQLAKQPALPEVQEMIRFVRQVLDDVAPYRRGLCPATRSYSSRS